MVPGADRQAVVLCPSGPRAAQHPDAEREEPWEEERAAGQRQQHGCGCECGRSLRAACSGLAAGWRGPLSLFLTTARPARPPPLGPRQHWPPARGAPPRDQLAGRDRRGQELGRGLAARLPTPLLVPAGEGRGLPAGRAPKRDARHGPPSLWRKDRRAVVICSHPPSIVASSGSLPAHHGVASQ